MEPSSHSRYWTERTQRIDSQDDDDDEEARAPDENHGEHREADVAGLVEVAADAQ